jgi:hypothetical protein
MSDTPSSPGHPTFMLLEDALRYETPALERILLEYRRMVPTAPLWRFVEDVQRQTYVYANLLELLKKGESAADIKKRFLELGLLPNYSEIPNPNAAKLAEWVLNKLGQIKGVLVELIGKRGGELLNELGLEVGGTVGLTVSLSFPPAVEITVEHSATAQTTLRFQSRA